MMSSPIRYKRLSDKDYDTVLPAAKQPTVIVFSASWSGSAVIVDTVMEKVIDHYTDSVTFYKVDIDENPELSKFFNVSSVPTIVFLSRGEILDLIKGFLPKKKLISRIEVAFSESLAKRA